VANALVKAFCHEIVDCDGCLLLSTHQVISERGRVIDDPVGYESTMNKRHMTDLCRIDEDDREALMIVGRALVKVWAERIALLFPGREVVFFLGGSDSVILRFHVRRSAITDWTDVTDREYLTSCNLEVYILRDEKLAQA
jgi:hypothetical protein